MQMSSVASTHDTGGFDWRSRLRAAGGSDADDLEPRRDDGDIGGAQCIAIHGARRERRLVAPRFKIARKDAAQSLIEFRRFGAKRFDT